MDVVPPAKKAPAKKVAKKAAAAPVDPNWVLAWTRLAGAVLGTTVTADRGKADWSVTGPIRARAERQRVRAGFADAIARGESIDVAVLSTVRAHARGKQWQPGWALAEGARRLPGGERAGTFGQVVLWHRRRQFVRCVPLLADYTDRDLAAYIPIEAVDAFLAEGSPESFNRARRIAAEPVEHQAFELVDLAGRFVVFGDLDLAARLIERADRLGAEQIDALDERHRRSLELIRGWLARTPKTVPDGSVPLAVIDYQSPDQDLTSGNLGDYIQTLALLGHVVRRQDVRFTGENGLGELATDLQARVRTDLRTYGEGAQVHLLDVNREFTSGDDLPDGTWMIAFGWHMHSLYELRYDFPYQPAIRPIFISFHLNRLDMLSEDALQYLREHGPVGCRDWTTVFLLLGAGVDAFFSGCLTTTVDGVFPNRDDVFVPPGVVGAIDIPVRDVSAGGRPVRHVSHQADEYRHMTITEGVRAAVDMLSGYQSQFARAVTNRLHGYLPLVSLRVPTEFRTRAPGDVRFHGLIGVEPGDPELATMQTTLRSLLATILDRIVAATPEAEVYDVWRRITADHVRAAKSEFEKPTAFAACAPTGLDVAGMVSAALSQQRRFGPAVSGEDTTTDLVLCFDRNLERQAAVLVESVLAAASDRVRLTVLGRGLPDAYGEWLSACFPDLPITIVPCDHVDYGPIRRIPSRITVSTMDRLLLPLLLTDVARCLYIDVDTVVLDDICELAAIDLGGAAFAARDSSAAEIAELRSAVMRAPASDAIDYLRHMSREHDVRAKSLNAGVLVLDLDRMRADDFTHQALGWVERYGFHDQDVMLAYGGRTRCTLDARWNALPVHEDVADPAIIHWAALAKPWDEALTFGRDRWQRFSSALDDHAPHFTHE